MLEEKVSLESLPENVRRVVELAIESGREGLPSLHDVVYVVKREDGAITICDNYERFCPLMLDYKDGQWSIRIMYSDLEPENISQEEAEANARLMFHG